MTLKQILETIQEIFPKIGWTQFVIDANSVYKDYCRETEILTKSDDLSFTTTTTSYTLADEFTDMDGEKITNIEFKDSSGDLVERSYRLTWEVADGVLTFYNYKGSDIDSIANITTITFHYVYVPTSLSGESDEPAVPKELISEAIIEGLYKKYYLRYPTDTLDRQGNVVTTVNLGLAREHEKEYKILERKGMIYKHRDLTTGRGEVDYF